jgi:hypothetical protein
MLDTPMPEYRVVNILERRQVEDCLRRDNEAHFGFLKDSDHRSGFATHTDRTGFFHVKPLCILSLREILQDFKQNAHEVIEQNMDALF